MTWASTKQHSTGGKAWLLGISKRGNAYLRRLFIHGARSIVMSLNRDNHAMGKWMSQLDAITHRNVLVVTPNGPNGTGCVLPIRQMSAAGKGENPRQINIAAQTATGAPMPNVLSRKPKTKMR